jgi:hypothetical protein
VAALEGIEQQQCSRAVEIACFSPAHPLRLLPMSRAFKSLGQALALASDHENARRNMADVRIYLERIGQLPSDADAEAKPSAAAVTPSSATGAAAAAADDDVYDRPSKRRPQKAPTATAAAASRAQAAAKKGKKPRPAMDRPRRPNRTHRDPLPRIHISHLHWKENEEFANGRSALLQQHGMRWRAERALRNGPRRM